MNDSHNTPARWLAHIQQYHTIKQPEVLADACALATELSAEDKSLPYADSSLSQGLHMASALLELQCDSHTLAAAIIYPSIYHYQPSKALLEKSLPRSVIKLAEGAVRLEAIQSMQAMPTKQNNTASKFSQNTLDNIRKMLLAIVDDVRVVLLKLAEHIAILHYVKQCEPSVQQEVAQQTMNIYAPLANRLGIGQLKWLLEDLSFRYLNPDDYKKLSKGLNMRRQEREAFIESMKTTLHQLFKNSQITPVEITGRAKHIYSIYRKTQRKKVPLAEIYDASALRILVPTQEDCYTALGIVHNQWEPITQEFDDYITNPKPNGYRSIHTAVLTEAGVNVEIQIRTYEMHELAELGVAAHWRYKEGGSKSAAYEQKIDLLREVMDWQRELNDEQDEEQNALYKGLFNDRVYVFTPNGDVFDLPLGATPLDFAYQLHTQVGHRCRGAKVNGALVQLTHPLKTGDRVEIVTAKQEKPSRDWLNPELGYLVTSQAKNKVRHWFKKAAFAEDLSMGQAMWEKAVRHESIKRSDLDRVVQRFNFKTADDLLAAIGSGNLTPITVIHQIKALLAPKVDADAIDTVPIIKPHKTATKKSATSGFKIEGVDDVLTQLARCCKPIPGDAIVGYITRGRGISIHQARCHNILQAQDQKPERLLEVQWGDETPDQYPVDLSISAVDRQGLVRDISNTVLQEDIALLGINTRINRAKNQAFIQLTIEIDDLGPLGKLLSQLQHIDGVIKVSRN